MSVLVMRGMPGVRRRQQGWHSLPESHGTHLECAQPWQPRGPSGLTPRKKATRCTVRVVWGAGGNRGVFY